MVSPKRPGTRTLPSTASSLVADAASSRPAASEVSRGTEERVARPHRRPAALPVEEEGPTAGSHGGRPHPFASTSLRDQDLGRAEARSLAEAQRGGAR